MAHTMEGKCSRMREEVNDQRSQESSEPRERRPTNSSTLTQPREEQGGAA